MQNDGALLQAAAEKVTWQRVETSGKGPGLRAAHSANLLADGVHMVVFGGWNGDAALNDVHVLNTVTMHWNSQDCSGAVPAPRNNHAAEMVGTCLHVHGGHNGSEWLSDYHVLDCSAWIWRSVAMAASPPRACHTLTLCGSRLLLFGGFDGSACYNSLYQLDPRGECAEIRVEAPAQLKGRNAHSAVTSDGADLIVMGGHSGVGVLTDVHLFDLEERQWCRDFRVFGAPPNGLRGHSCTRVSERHFLVFGGFDGRERHNSVCLLRVDKQRRAFYWTTLENDPATAPVGRQRHSAVAVGPHRSVLIFGGFSGEEWLDDVYRLDVAPFISTQVYGSVLQLTADLCEMWRSAKFADIVFVLKDQQRVPAHRCLLAARCAYFDKMFASAMQESHQREVPIVEWTADVFTLFLEFLYTGRVTRHETPLLCELLKLADCYGVANLKEFTAICLEDQINSLNVCDVLRAADVAQAEDLRAFCQGYVVRHGAEVAATKGFEDLAQTPQLLMQLTKLTMRRETSADVFALQPGDESGSTGNCH